MAGRLTRIAALASFGLLAAFCAVPSGAAATAAPGDITLHIGQKTAFTYTPPSGPALTQKLPNGDGCNRAFSATPDLVHVSATAPTGASVGKFQGKLGVCFQDPSPGPRSGRVDGDKGEALTIALGADPSLANMQITSADLHLEGRGTLDVAAYAGSTLVGNATLDSATATPQGTGPLADNYVVHVAPGPGFDRMVITAGPTSFYGVVGGRQGSGDTVMHLASTGGTLNPGDTAPTSTNDGISATLTYNNGNQPIDYTLTEFTSPDGAKNVWLTKNNDPSELLTMTIDWGVEPFCDFTHGLCPHTKIDTDNDGPQPPVDAQLCGAGEPNATTPWCITDQHYTIVPGTPQKVHLTETFAGSGDPRWSR